jgi:hypothetical protein
MQARTTLTGKKDTRARSLVCEDIPTGRRNVGQPRERWTTKNRPGTASTLLLLLLLIIIIFLLHVK